MGYQPPYCPKTPIPLAITQEDRNELRELVDIVWNEATESTAVPSTDWADKLIDKWLMSDD